jgi:hypothetical protein
MSDQAIVKMDEATLENVLISGDLSKLTSPQRVQYYRTVCQSLGLNPFTKPFEYITLNGKLTLYAKKDATDQLRGIQGVSIDDVDITETDTQFIVKVKGHNRDNRQDVEVGVVNKGDMQGNLANAQMKAVTKGKRRLTLSLCGLGWLDETEIETIPSAKPVNVKVETGEIIQAVIRPGVPESLEIPYNMTDKNGNVFGELSDEELDRRIKAYEDLGSKISEDGSAKLQALRQLRDYWKSLTDTAKDLGGVQK